MPIAGGMCRLRGKYAMYKYEIENPIANRQSDGENYKINNWR